MTKVQLKIYIFLVCAVMIWGAVTVWALYSEKQGSAVDPIYGAVHGDVTAIAGGIANYSAAIDAVSGTVSGVLVPNGIEDSQGLSRAMADLKEVEVGDTILYVEVRKNIGLTPVFTSKGFQTPFGVVQSNSTICSAIADSGGKINNEVFDNDSSVGLFMSYCGYYLPNVKVVPLFIDRAMSETALNGFLAKLDKQDGVTVIVADLVGNICFKGTESEGKNILEKAGEVDISEAFGSDAVVPCHILQSLVEKSNVLTYFYSDEDNLTVFYGKP